MAEVKLNSLDKINKRLGIEPNGPVQAFFTETCYKYMDKYVPKDRGLLRAAKLEPDKIIYQREYAEYQYYGERKDGSHKVVNYSTPNTGPYWDKRMVSAEMDDLVQDVQDYAGGKK